jgi:hypothetical protein
MFIVPMHDALSASSGYRSITVAQTQTPNEPPAHRTESLFTTLEGSRALSFSANVYTELTTYLSLGSAWGATDILMSNMDDESAAGFSRFIKDSLWR